ncbi:hypothetical protein [Salimicrobium album]|uniref:Uncharacterized protein n=1 Tax=Salimicrobium album TaxID=50717 RepID=A0A1H3DEN8_9BACI|nr:hypothetical protein [Salimicrobium album]SDX64807.1 hypothetical protein SAMN04488081_0935 [Salimicrobium album]
MNNKDMTVEEVIEQRDQEIADLKAELETAEGGEKRKFEKQINKLEKMNKKSRKWSGLADKVESTGEAMQRTGKSMTKAGMKTTAITWTPVIYGGYKAVQHSKKKNQTPEQELMDLVKECEQAYKDKKIDEATMKHYITDYVENYYRA